MKKHSKIYTDNAGLLISIPDGNITYAKNWSSHYLIFEAEGQNFTLSSFGKIKKLRDLCNKILNESEAKKWVKRGYKL